MAAASVSRYRWTVLGAGVVAQASFSAIFFGLPAIAPAVRNEYELSLTQVGVVLAALSVGLLATLVLWGIVADRIGERTVLATGLAGCSAALVAAGTFSLSWNGLSFTAAAEIAGRSRSGAAIGLQQSFLAAGSIATPIAFAAIVHASSWRTGFVLAALSPLLGYALLSPLAERSP